MAASKEDDFYGVLGLKKECTETELRIAYKKLALKWHPDRVSASGNSNYVEDAKKKFQAIQQAYSVLSDGNKRFMYDVGVYDCNDDDGMGEFLNEMAAMMSQTKPNENGNESFEELQELFDELFHSDIEQFSASSPSTCSSSSSFIENETYTISNEMKSGYLRGENSHFEGFCIGPGGTSGKCQGGESSRGKNTRKARRKSDLRTHQS